MLTPRTAAFAFIALLSTSMSAVIGVSLALFQKGLKQGFAGARLRARGPESFVALPATWLPVPMTRTRPVQPTRHPIIPPKGVKNP